jgi:hypothetical protein
MEDKTLLAMGVGATLLVTVAAARMMSDSSSKDEGVLASVGWSL